MASIAGTGRPQVYCSVVCRRRAELPRRRLMRQVHAARALVVERESACAKAIKWNNPEMQAWHDQRAQRARDRLTQLEALAAA